ncbi:conjugal transfer protein TraO [Flagellimonas sp.]|uniref:conjugal transfer protein TraO n=1 Tax=Flagellimonas sp. TaxID=2058762 RepID=UPI003BA9AF47
MTKTKILLVMCCACCSYLVSAQRSKTALGVSAGYVPEGYAVEASFNYYNNLTDFIKTGVMVSFSNELLETNIEVPYNNYLVNVGYFTKLVQSPQSGFSAALGGGISLGYEYINNGENILSDGSVLLSQSGFVYGLMGGVDLDIFLSSSLSMFLPANFIYQFNSDMGNSIIYAGLGVRYSFIQ